MRLPFVARLVLIVEALQFKEGCKVVTSDLFDFVVMELVQQY